MPEMSGLDLLAAIAGEREDLHVVIVSGYNEFDYAREALRFNVVDYLVKPLKTGEVADLLARIRSEKEQALRKKEEAKRLTHEIIRAEWSRLLNESDVQEAHTALARRLNEKYRRSAFRLTIVPVAAASRHDHAAFERSKRAITERFVTLSGVEDVFVAEMRHFGCALLIACGQRTVSLSGHGRELWADAGRCLLESVPEVQAIAYGPLFVNDAVESFCTPGWIKTLERKLFYSGESVVFVENEAPAAELSYALPDRFADEFAALVAREDRIHAGQKLSELYFALRANPVYSVDSVRTAYGELLKRASLACGIRTEGALAEREDAFIQSAIHGAFNLKSLHEIANGYVDAQLEKIGELMKDKRRRLIKEIKQYVRNHLADSITLTGLAEHFRLSVEYLSYLFKKEEGINFNQYLKQVRVDRAKAILERDCSIKIYELAVKVGYNDAKHFSKVFREQTGLTPRDYVESVYARRGTDTGRQSNA
jgi:two-component system response regulator YesN